MEEYLGKNPHLEDIFEIVSHDDFIKAIENGETEFQVKIRTKW